jgi:hypothetical protein
MGRTESDMWIFKAPWWLLHLCRLRTIHSGPLIEHLIMYLPHARFMGFGKPT